VGEDPRGGRGKKEGPEYVANFPLGVKKRVKKGDRFPQLGTTKEGGFSYLSKKGVGEPSVSLQRRERSYFLGGEGEKYKEGEKKKGI